MTQFVSQRQILDPKFTILTQLLSVQKKRLSFPLSILCKLVAEEDSILYDTYMYDTRVPNMNVCVNSLEECFSSCSLELNKEKIYCQINQRSHNSLLISITHNSSILAKRTFAIPISVISHSQLA